MLICIYYRVASGDSPRVIAAVREFQRTLRESGRADEVEVLFRCDLPAQDPPEARPDSNPSHGPADELPVASGVDATVMETYCLSLPPGPRSGPALRDFLATLEAAAAPLSALLRGTRHVELFAPCAS